MEEIKKFVEKNPEFKSEDRVPFLELAKKNEKGAVVGTGVHKVKILRAEPATNRDYATKELVDGFNVFFLEGKEEKRYFIPQLDKSGKKLHYLTERFANIPEGTEILLEYKRIEGTFKGYIDVKMSVLDGVDDDSDDIPIVEEDDIPEYEED
jgi:hypothetical protein